jgi:hypothetical protein
MPTSEKEFSRRRLFYSTLLTGVVPIAGFGRTPTLTMLGIIGHKKVE